MKCDAKMSGIKKLRYVTYLCKYESVARYDNALLFGLIKSAALHLSIQ